YLDLANHPAVVTAAVEATRRYGAGTGASRLVSGAMEIQSQLEAALAEFVGAEATLLFSSGYLANISTIQALVGPADAIFSDELNHASIIDGCLLSRAETHVYPHGDLAALREMLARSTGRRRLVVSDSVFSMDADS